MTRLNPTISAHLIAASDMIHANALKTIQSKSNSREVVSQIDAAQSFVTAAEYLYEAAERVAAGEPLGSDDIVLALRAALVKTYEGLGVIEREVAAKLRALRPEMTRH